MSLDLEDLWLFTLRNDQKKESFVSLFLLSWPWEIPDSREMPVSPSQVLSSQRNRAVPRDHAVSVADLESDWGFRQLSAVSQNIKNLKQKRHLSISASFSTLL